MNKKTPESKKKIANAIKQMFDYLEHAESADNATFEVNINHKRYDNIDIAKIVRTFSDTLSDDKEPQIEIIQAKQSEPIPNQKSQIPEKPVDDTPKKVIPWLNYLGDNHGYFHHESDQLAKETDILYIKICRLINRYYIKSGKSFRKLASKYQDDFFYTSPYVSIYRIAQQYVLSYYRYGTVPKAYYELKTIGDYFDKTVEKKTLKFIEQHIKTLSPATSETLKVLGLTVYGTAPIWWDEDGTLRAKKVFTKEQIELLDISDKRTTKLWKVPQIKRQMLSVYLSIYDQLKQMMTNREIADEINTYILGPPYDKNPFVRGYITKSLYASGEWLRVVESKFRAFLPKLKPLDQDKVWHNLNYKFPIHILATIEALIDTQIENISEDDFIIMCEGYLLVTPDDWSFAAQYIAELSTKAALAALIKYQSNDFITKIAGKLIKLTQDQEVLRLALYLKAKDKLVKSEQKCLEGVIYLGNLAQFKALVKSDAKIDAALIKTLNSLKSPIRKTIALSDHKLGHAKINFKKTTEIVDDYLGETQEVFEDAPVVVEASAPKENNRENVSKTSSNIVNQFLTALLEGAISLEQAKIFAKDYGKSINIMIDDINQIFYNIIEDQLIRQDNHNVYIDEFYTEDVKTYITTYEE